MLYILQFSPIFFTQERVGHQGKIFKLIKFRTMRNLKGQDGKLLPDSERLSRLGKFLRRTSLDELPQVIHIWFGQMRLVGPRPLLPEYLNLYSPEQARRHEVKPGLSGWVQVKGRNALSWQQRFELDIWYVDHRSYWLDLFILWLTFKKAFQKSTAPIFSDKFDGNN